MASRIAIAPIPNAAMRTTTSSFFSLTWPFLITLALRSWATEDANVRVSPATTARMVAKATAEITASRMEPPNVPSPPPTASASSGEAALPAELSTWLPSPCLRFELVAQLVCQRVQALRRVAGSRGRR